VLSIWPNALSIRKCATHLHSSAHDAQLYVRQGNVRDPDPHVLGLPDSDPLVRGKDFGSGYFPILINVLSGLK
jgi:hypothetical protein